MSIIEDLSVPYHQQDTDYYCGAACAQMVLAQIGAGLLDQDALYADNHNHSTTEAGWYTAPDGLQWTMNNLQPSGSLRWFALFGLATNDLISRKIVWTIHHYPVAPIALVFGSQHWIVVRGYMGDRAPTTSVDNDYTISALMINNPDPPVPTGPPFPPPPPHGPSDGCGNGGVRGVADEHITYSTWLSDYMTGVPSGHWHGQFVAVCDPDQPPVQPGRPPASSARRADHLLSATEAVKVAVKGLKDYGLLEQASWRTSLARTRPGRAILVQRLDRSDSFYYIVRMTRARGTSPVLVSVDARLGTYKQAVRSSNRGHNPGGDLNFDGKTAINSLLRRRIDLGEGLGRVLIRKEASCLYPTLVWKPCRESLSPFYPFHMVTVGNHRIFIRIDGKVFTALHDQDRGI